MPVSTFRHACHKETPGVGSDIDVTLGAVEIANGLHVLLQAIGRKRIAGVHQETVRTELRLLDHAGWLRAADAFRDVRVAEKFVAGDFYRADFILAAFIDDDADHQRPRSRMLELDVLDVEINVALIAIKFRELLLVIVELFVLENSAAGHPGEHPMLPGLDGLAELASGKTPSR